MMNDFTDSPASSSPTQHTTPPPSHLHSTNPEDLFASLENYPWSSDASFQSGLRAILGPSPDPLQTDDLTLHARVFYYVRKYNLAPSAVDFAAYKEWRSTQPEARLSSLAEQQQQATAGSRSSISLTQGTGSRDLGSMGGGLTPPASGTRLFATPTSSERSSGHGNDSINPSPAHPHQPNHETNRSTPNYPAATAEAVRRLQSNGSGKPPDSPTPGSRHQRDASRATLPDPQHGRYPEPPKPATFDEIVHMIQTGQPIPGIKEIPDTVLVGHGSQSTASKRPKPWERGDRPAGGEGDEPASRRLFGPA